MWDRHIFLTGLENDKLMVIAVRRADGKLLWKQVVFGPLAIDGARGAYKGRINVGEDLPEI